MEAEQEEDQFFFSEQIQEKGRVIWEGGGRSFTLLRRRSITWTHLVITNQQTNAVKPNLGIANGPKETWR